MVSAPVMSFTGSVGVDSGTWYGSSGTRVVSHTGDPKGRDLGLEAKSWRCPYRIPTCKGCVVVAIDDRDHDDTSIKQDTRFRQNDYNKTRLGLAQQYHDRLHVHRPGIQAQNNHTFAQFLEAISPQRPPNQSWNDIRTSFVAWNFTVGVINAAKASGFLKAWDISRSVAVVGAADALSTLNIGLNARDHRLLGEGRKRYQLTITALRDEMARPGAVGSDSVLNAVFTVCHLEVYTIISTPESLGWQTHVAGVLSIFQKRGINGFKTPPAQALLQNCRHLILGDALLRRKRTFLGDSRWIAAASQMPNTAVELMNIAVRVPEALEIADLACVKAGKAKSRLTPTTLRIVVDALARLVKLQDELQKWLLKYYKQWTSLPYHITDAHTFPAYTECCGELLALFPKAYTYPSFVTATTHEYYWVMLYLVRHAIADVARLSKDEDLLYPGEGNEEQKLDAATTECVNNLCQSVAYLSKPEHKSFGIMSTNLSLHFVQAWFQRQGEDSKLEWCRRLKTALLKQGDFEVPLRLEKPIFIWWMLPENSIPTKPNQTLTAADDAEKEVARDNSVVTQTQKTIIGKKVIISRQPKPLKMASTKANEKGEKDVLTKASDAGRNQHRKTSYIAKKSTKEV